MTAISLSNEKLDQYKEILLREKRQTEEILNKLNEIQKNGMKESSGDSSSYQIHQADMGSDTQESEKRVFYYDEELSKLKLIHEALHRIYDKSYGICEICGDYIPENRLAIIPYARFCIECKRKEEAKRKVR
jgi:DnaK suppressor protein